MMRTVSAVASHLARRSRRSERGYALAFTAIILIPLLAISAMATDIGAWYDEATELQKAADAAALAGVVWLPDYAKAREVALQTAKANGFDDADPNIDVTVTQLSRSELKVSIRNSDVDIFFATFFLDRMVITREAVGSYVQPVPLGSPKNYFGTGNMLSGNDAENMWAAINGYCSPREQGDPFAARYWQNWPNANQNPVCPGSMLNDQYVAAPELQYEYAIYAPPGRTKPIVIHLYSPGMTGSEEGANNANATSTTAWSTTFTLRAPDNTPFDDSDNPVATCSGTGELNPRSYGYASSHSGWPNAKTFSNWSNKTWNRFCTIPANAPSGTYLLGVRNEERTTNTGTINIYSVMASYDGSGNRCDSRTDAMCPTVNGRSWMSVYATSGATIASLFLAEVGAEHAGKQMEITLFDPGENGEYIEILDPAGNPVKFNYYTTDWVFSGSNITKLDVSNCTDYPQPGRGSKCRFNDRYVVITVDLPDDYATKYPGSKWWKVRYKFMNNVTDRTTWAVRIIGDPVHLAN